MVEVERDYTTEELEARLNSRDGLYDYLTRLDKFLPHINSPICTIIFMNEALNKTIYIPN